MLEALGIRYAVVGSLALCVHGVYPATANADLLAQIAPECAAALAAALGTSWYADAPAIEQAIRQGRPFNLIHIHTAQKIDIFPATSEFHATQLDRARNIRVFTNQREMSFPVATAEDILLAKLQWYRTGGEVSDRQWNDITGLLATNPDLDFEYVDSWAARLRVEDLLARARAEVARD